jgi:beta-galactosidase
VLQPGESAKVVVPFDRDRRIPEGSEAHLLVRWRTSARLPWAPKGDVVGWDQLPVALASDASTGIRSACSDARWARTGGTTALRGEQDDLVIDLEGDGFTVALDGEVVVQAPPGIELWRGAIDNDGIKLWAGQEHTPLGRWLGWGLHRLHWQVVGAESAPVPSISSEGHGADPDVVVRHTRRIEPASGGVVVHERVEVPDQWDDLPRVGARFELPASFDRVRSLCLGPHENEPDRRSGAVLGRWDRLVDAEPLPYLMPQDFGLRCGLRWMAVEQRGRGRRLGVVVGGLGPHAADLMGSATRFRPEDLFAARDQTELHARDATVVVLDVAHRGVGTGSCGPDTLPKYRIGPGVHEWRWFLAPYRAGRDDPAEVSRRVRSSVG